MTNLGNGLLVVKRHDEALSVKQTELSLERRLGRSESSILAAQGNLASTYEKLGQHDQALRMKRDVYSGRLKLNGTEHKETLIAASNYAISLFYLKSFKEGKKLLRKSILVARRVYGENDEITVKMRALYAQSLYYDAAATLDDLREAVSTLEAMARTARRVFGISHPPAKDIEADLRRSRAALATSEKEGS